jgi:hypothetical protein
VEVGGSLIVIALILFVVGFLTRKKRPVPEAAAKPSRMRRTPPPAPMVPVTHIRPPVSDFHVHGDEARVFFAVTAPPEPDDVLNELLVGEAVEIVREKAHSLPISQVNHVVAFGNSAEGATEMGRTTLDTPGQLPVRSEVPSILNLAGIALDPLADDFGAEPPVVPETVVRIKEDRLGPLIDELRLPKAVDIGLRAQGIDPATMTAGQLLLGMLALVGYESEPGPVANTHIVTRDKTRFFVRQDDYRPDDHPEVALEALDRFAFEFQASQADRGLYVSEKYGPFAVYDRERRDPRVRYLTRERLQNLIDGLAIG